MLFSEVKVVEAGTVVYVPLGMVANEDEDLYAAIVVEIGCCY